MLSPKTLRSMGFRVKRHRDVTATLYQQGPDGQALSKKARYPSARAAWEAARRIEEMLRSLGRAHAGKSGKR